MRNILDLIEFGKQHSSTHDKGEKFRQTSEKEGFDQVNHLLPPLPDVPDEYFRELEAVLEKPIYNDIYQEYQRLAKRRQRVEWYSLNNGPSNLRKLAEYLNIKTVYDTLYRRWSKISHVANPDHLTLPLENGTRILGPIRNPLNIAHISCSSLGILLEASQLMIKRFLSSDFKKFSKWWNDEVREKHTLLCELEESQLEWYKRTFIDKSQNQ